MSRKYKIGEQDRIYFITITIVKWVNIFNNLECVQIVIDSLKFCQKEKGLVIHAWCLMPNHLHMIVGRSGIMNIEDIIRDLKKYTSVHLTKALKNQKMYKELSVFQLAAEESKKHQYYKVWQDGFHPVVLDSNKLIDQKLDYIHYNPVSAGITELPEEFVYSSAKDYYTEDSGMVEIEIIG